MLNSNGIVTHLMNHNRSKVLPYTSQQKMVTAAINIYQIKSRKSPGPSGIVIEMIRAD